MPLSFGLLDSVAGLNLDRPPVAVGFLPGPPADLRRIEKPMPAGCSYWKHASEGHAFYTTPEDHENCAVGAFTHGVTLSPDKAKELEALVGTMVELRYLRRDEVARIPRRSAPMQIVAYAPLGQASFDPDVVVFRGNARQVMLISEAALAAGALESGVMGRPACSMIPQAVSSAAGVASVGCIGNRVYTELGNDELYFAIPGEVLPRVLEQLDIIRAANAALESFHRERAASLA